MKAIIPVAGMGTRLRPHTHTLPKVLLNVAGKPILGHILDTVVDAGISQVLLVVGHLGDMIQDWVRSHYDLDLKFVEQKEPLGLGHAVGLGLDREDNGVLIILGDTILELDMVDFLGSSCSCLGVKAVKNPRRFGVVEEEKGFVVRLVEKPEHPPSNLAIAGIYYLKSGGDLWKCVQEMMAEGRKTGGEYQLTDALQLMVDRGEKLKAYPIDGWYDCGKPETLLATNRHLLDKRGNRKGKAHLYGKNALVIPPVSIGDGVKIEHSLVGPYVTLADGASVGNSIITDSIIGEKAVVERSLLAGSLIADNALVRGAFRKLNVGDSSAVDFE